ncbi:MAG: twin-arginine translocation signal domain-containing protein, partial [Halodesulfurarchaeum sp.]
MSRPDKDRIGFDRRKFLKATGAGAVTASL